VSKSDVDLRCLLPRGVSLELEEEEWRRAIVVGESRGLWRFAASGVSE
jgi:hypothetical protein